MLKYPYCLPYQRFTGNLKEKQKSYNKEISRKCFKNRNTREQENIKEMLFFILKKSYKVFHHQKIVKILINKFL